MAPAAELPVAVTRNFPTARLADVERTWGPARVLLGAAAAAANVVLEHGHWDWGNKAGYYRPGWHCLVAVEAEGEVQGLMAAETLLRPSRLAPGGWVVYVDYVEAAPWNLAVQGVQDPRYGGVGRLLVGEAVRMSTGRTAAGRVGLHSLPRAEDFYRGCRMTDLGPDPAYNDLVYFEYPAAVTAGWLTDRRFSA